MAVLEKRCGIPLQNQDIFVNVVGGISLTEPAVDLGIMAAVISNFRGVPVDKNTFLFGEVGLGGEIRAVSRPLARMAEAAKLGFKTCFLPRRCLGDTAVEKMEMIGIDSIDDLLNTLF
jgi:DNA repair protein RadA/Sms